MKSFNENEQPNYNFLFFDENELDEILYNMTVLLEDGSYAMLGEYLDLFYYAHPMFKNVVKL